MSTTQDELYTDIFNTVLYFLEEGYEPVGASEQGAAFNLLYAFINLSRDMKKLMNNTLLKKAFKTIQHTALYCEYQQALTQVFDSDSSSDSES